MNNDQIVYTLTAKCRDCYKCLKACPVKAIKMTHGQAYVDNKKCIHCGTCIKECSQNAKVYRSDVEKVKTILKSGSVVAASLAPSFPAVFNDKQIHRLISALRMLGFLYIEETAVAASDVAVYTKKIISETEQNFRICTACPVTVSYIEKYRPGALNQLTPIISPMVAHGKLLKEKYGKSTKVVFIGPCIAKKAEAEREEFKGIIDAVITFSELEEWLIQETINLATCEESGFNEHPSKHTQLFPLPGGLIKAGELDDDPATGNSFHVSGFFEFKEALEYLEKNRSEKTLLEPLFCAGGCINGPGITPDLNLFARKKALINYYKELTQTPMDRECLNDKLLRDFQSREIKTVNHGESEINRILEKTGKASPETQLNCGACGYNSCRDKAIAVLDGMAEPEMCVPYMRRLAEQRTDKIIETSPNGIVILDKYLKIIKMNPAFKKLFRCTNSLLGKNISYLIDPVPFEKLIMDQHQKIEKTEHYKNYNIICHEIFYSLKEEEQFVGIFMDITGLKKKNLELKNIKEQTIFQARELLEHQLDMAQKIALFLGENTARSEDLVKKLMSLSGESNET